MLMVHTEEHCDYLHQDSHRENVLDSKNARFAQRLSQRAQHRTTKRVKLLISYLAPTLRSGGDLIVDSFGGGTPE